MAFVPLLLLLCILFWTCFHVLTSILRPRNLTNLPPGPRPFPIIGNILQLGQNPHQSLAKLSETYGPLMHLKLGRLHTIVVSSPEIARQVFQKHDLALSGRPPLAASEVFNHHEASLSWLPTTTGRWRALRRICRDQMFSPQKLDACRALREEKMRQMRDHVRACADLDRALDIADVAFTTSLNVISATMFSTDLAGYGSESSHELKEIVHGSLRVLGAPNVADYFPIFKAFDPQGIKRRSAFYVGKMLGIFDGIIDRRLHGEEVSSDNDLLATLLDISRDNESELTRNDIIHLLMELFVGGIDTSATTVEWAMAELIRKPKMIEKLRHELQTVIELKGGHDLEESDISRLPYLQAAVKETFRLHPAGPLLVPHKAESDVEINNYLVPKNAQVLVNVWKIGRDSRIWSDPDSFEPKRFLDSKIDIKGHDFELIPFGSGRRICPGLPLAYRTVHFMVATLVKDFDWKLEGGMKLEEINMEEKFEFSLQRVVPLKAIPVKL